MVGPDGVLNDTVRTSTFTRSETESHGRVLCKSDMTRRIFTGPLCLPCCGQTEVQEAEDQLGSCCNNQVREDNGSDQGNKAEVVRGSLTRDPFKRETQALDMKCFNIQETKDG